MKRSEVAKASVSEYLVPENHDIEALEPQGLDALRQSVQSLITNPVPKEPIDFQLSNPQARPTGVASTPTKAWAM